MTNPISSSPNRNSQTKADRIRRLLEEGKWPPAGHPFRELLRLPPLQVQEWFQLPSTQAYLQGVQELLALVEATLRYEVNERKVIDTPKVYELRSLVDGYRQLLAVREEIYAYGMAIQKDGGTASGRPSESREDAGEVEREISRRDNQRITSTVRPKVRQTSTGY